MSPYRVLYQRDPVLPFQFMDWVKNCGLDSALDCLNLHGSDDPVCDLVERYGNQFTEMYSFKHLKT